MTRAAHSKTSVVVTVADSHLDRVTDLAEHMRQAGLSVDQVLGATGVVTGTASKAATARLRRLSGVQAVEAVDEVRIAPPDSEIQ